MQKWIVIFVVGAIAVSLSNCARDTRTSVILISIDTLRAANVGDYGYERPTTPNLDQFAKDSLAFRGAIANSNNTLISHMSMFTSLYPVVHQAEPGSPLAQGNQTLAELFREAGYRTAFYAAHGDWLTAEYGFDKGFETFRSEYAKAPTINAWVTDWLKSVDEEPVFLFVHYYDVHSDFTGEGPLPYQAPESIRGMFTDDYDGTFTGCDDDASHCASMYLQQLNVEGDSLSQRDRNYIEALYDEGLVYADSMVGELLSLFKEQGLFDRSLIVITSDHGEEFQEHGQFLHGSIAEPVLKVPLWIRFPDTKLRGEVEGFAQSVDLAPTILEAVGLEVPDRMQGESLLNLARGGSRKSQFGIVNRMAMRSERWTLMPKRDASMKLFDSSNDPGYQHDVAAENQSVIDDAVRELTALKSRYPEMKGFFGKSLRAAKKRKLVIEQDERDRLEALGYVVPIESGSIPYR